MALAYHTLFLQLILDIGHKFGELVKPANRNLKSNEYVISKSKNQKNDQSVSFGISLKI
jgi:hypothetical protein